MRKRHLSNCIWPLVLALLAPLAAPALDPSKAVTQYGHEVWLIEEGLPQSSVQALVQTRDGYIWIGTQEGLARFDGVRFKVFDKANTPELVSNIVTSLWEAPDGTLWVGTDGGGAVRYQGGKFSPLTVKDGLSSDRITCLKGDSRGALWIGTDGGGLNCLRGGKVTVYQKAQGYPSTVAWAIHEDRSGAVWFGSGKGLVRYEGSHFTTFTSKDGLLDDAVSTLCEDSEGTLWIGTYGGLNVLRQGRWSSFTSRDGLCNDFVQSLFEDRGGRCLWIGTSAGLSRMRNGRFENYTTKEGLSNNTVLSLRGDAEGSLWIGTNGGLDRFRDTKFSVFGIPEGLQSDVVLGVLEARDGSLWIGTDGGGVSRYKDGHLTTYKAKEGLGSDAVMGIAEDASGTVWFGTDGAGLARFEKDRIVHVPFNGTALDDTSIPALVPARDGALWIGSSGGLGRLEGGKATLWTKKEGLSNNAINCLLEDASGALWAGTDGGGLDRFEKGRFTVYGHADGLPDDVVLSLQQEEAGGIWIGTNNGLSRFKDGKFVTLTTRQGLFDDKIFLILDDGRGTFWLTCNKGIFTVPKRDLAACADGRASRVKCTVYGKSDGLRTSECNGATQPVGWRGHDGKLYFATLKGVGLIDPDTIRLNTTPPPVVIEEVIVDGAEVAPGDFITLEPGSHRIEFQYTGLSLVAPERIKFKYKLEGLDPDWVNAGGSREAFYTGIPSGAYRFRVIACNNDGVWNEKGAVFTFRQKPRFYETPWFYLALALCFVFMGASAQRIRVLRLKAREAELVRQVEAQTAELARANAELKARSVELEEANIALVERGEQLEILNQELKRLSTLDPLTGIAHRRESGRPDRTAVVMGRPQREVGAGESSRSGLDVL